jgi:hypothetical protein
MEIMRWRILYRVAARSKRRCCRLFLPNNAITPHRFTAIRPRWLAVPVSVGRAAARITRHGRSLRVIALSIGIAWVNPDAAKFCWLLLAVTPRIADRWSSRQSV